MRFYVTEDMVHLFSLLTGDRSPLHVSSSFARRSAYRSPVIHGMLPVAFLSLVSILRRENYVTRLTSLSGRFVAPVYAGEILELSVQPRMGASADAGVRLDYQVKKVGSGGIATEGELSIEYEPMKMVSPRVPGQKSHRGLLLNPLSPQDLSLEEMAVGSCDELEFAVSDEMVGRLVEILGKGVESGANADTVPSGEWFHYPDLLAILLVSTMVGMCIPGASATFLGFSMTLNNMFEYDVRYCLRGTVGHVSRSTRVIKIAISAYRQGKSDGQEVMLGKAATLVNAPARMMPTSEELRATATDYGLKGKVVLITGASRGIGETTAKLFALFGARVVVNFYLGKSDADRIVREIIESGGEAIAVQANITYSDQANSMVGRAIEEFGTIDILVNNAVRDYKAVPFLDLTWDEIEKDIDVIVKGAFYCSKACIPAMLRSGGGKIINVTSIAVDDPPPGHAKYVLAKSALSGMTRSLAAEYAAKNIQVNTVAPSFVETDLVSQVTDGLRKQIAKDTPMQRLASPIEVAKAIVFLASSFASYTTGQKLMVTGGKLPYL